MLQSTYNEIPGEFELEQEFDLEKPFERPDQNIRFQVISHYPRYGQSIAGLPASEREKIHRVASFVAHALRSGSESVRLIRVVGHADLDTPRRPTFEQQIGRSRAKEVLGALLDAIDRVDAGPERPVPPYSSRIAWDIQSAGATQLVVANPRSELDRSRNRRVEISVVPYSALPPASAGTSTTRVAFATSAALDVSAGAAIHDFLRRAPNDLLRYNDPLMGPDQPDRRICVSAAATKATQLCGSTSRSDRGGIPCNGPLTLTPQTGGRCYSRTPGVTFLAGKDYRAPLTTAVRASCCTRTTFCSPAKKPLSNLPNGQYLVLLYKPAPLKQMVDNLKCLLDRGCVVPVGVLSGICDDKPDLSGICKPIPLQNKWRDCWEHWLLIIGYDGDRFVFWDSAESSMMGPVKAGKDNHYFGFLYYDSKNHRLSTATTNAGVQDPLEVNPSGYHTQGTPQMFGQKRYQVTSTWNGLPWKTAGRQCKLG